MGKISPVSAKYIINADITIEGAVDRPDVIGAVFGQTEGLLGADLELRELQRSGRIGRIEVNVETKGGKTQGSIIIPSSLDKAETAVVGAALEIIERIGPCNAKIGVQNIDDIRISKRDFVIKRAKELLSNLMQNVIPDSREIAEEVAHSVRVMEIVSYGKDKLPAGPFIDESDEIIIVEGRADVLNLLKHNIKNSIAMNGTSVPKTIIELCKEKIVTVFVDGDRGGQLIIKDLLSIADIDFVAKAPDGKEVEEITSKEIHKAIRSKISGEQMKLELPNTDERIRPQIKRNHSVPKPPQRFQQKNKQRYEQREVKPKVNEQESKKFKKMIEDLIGTRGAYILDNKLNVLGRVPLSELSSTITSVKDGIYAVALDGPVNQELVKTAERARIKHVIGMDKKYDGHTRTNIMTVSDFK